MSVTPDADPGVPRLAGVSDWQPRRATRSTIDTSDRDHARHQHRGAEIVEPRPPPQHHQREHQRRAVAARHGSPTRSRCARGRGNNARRSRAPRRSAAPSTTSTNCSRQCGGTIWRREERDHASQPGSASPARRPHRPRSTSRAAAPRCRARSRARDTSTGRRRSRRRAASRSPSPAPARRTRRRSSVRAATAVTTSVTALPPASATPLRTMRGETRTSALGALRIAKAVSRSESCLAAVPCEACAVQRAMAARANAPRVPQGTELFALRQPLLADARCYSRAPRVDRPRVAGLVGRAGEPAARRRRVALRAPAARVALRLHAHDASSSRCWSRSRCRGRSWRPASRGVSVAHADHVPLAALARVRVLSSRCRGAGVSRQRVASSSAGCARRDAVVRSSRNVGTLGPRGAAVRRRAAWRPRRSSARSRCSSSRRSRSCSTRSRRSAPAFTSSADSCARRRRCSIRPSRRCISRWCSRSAWSGSIGRRAALAFARAAAFVALAGRRHHRHLHAGGPDHDGDSACCRTAASSLFERRGWGRGTSARRAGGDRRWRCVLLSRSPQMLVTRMSTEGSQDWYGAAYDVPADADARGPAASTTSRSRSTNTRPARRGSRIGDAAVRAVVSLARRRTTKRS